MQLCSYPTENSFSAISLTLQVTIKIGNEVKCDMQLRFRANAKLVSFIVCRSRGCVVSLLQREKREMTFASLS